MTSRLLPCTLALWLPLAAQAATVVQDPAAHEALLTADPGAGGGLLVDFEDQSAGAVLGEQYASSGIHFTGPDPLFVLPEAFGAAGHGARLAVVGFSPDGSAELSVVFDEPQFALGLWVVDGEGVITIEAWLGPDLVDSVVVDVEGEGLDGGVFRGIWFDEHADTVRFFATEVEDGFGLDDIQAAVPGSVDNDGDGLSEGGGDCDDSDTAVRPGASDGCDGVDSDCDGVIDSDDDLDGDGVAGCMGDCDDADPSVFPGAEELCNARDDDCDGDVDEPLDADGDGFGRCDGDCDDSDASVHPGAAEACNGVDDDCDGVQDESPDGDGDGWTVCEGDCDDADPSVFPGEGCDDPGDDDDASDDDDTSDDDDSGGDDDDSGGDDDDSGGDDDDTGGDDDDAAGDDDDTGGDDDDAAGDDDDAGGDDDDASGDDDDAAAAVRGIAGGGCSVGVCGGGGRFGLILLAVAIRRRRA